MSRMSPLCPTTPEGASAAAELVRSDGRSLALVSATLVDTELAEGVGMRLNTFLQNFARARRLLAECLARAGIAVDLELGT